MITTGCGAAPAKSLRAWRDNRQLCARARNRKMVGGQGLASRDGSVSAELDEHRQLDNCELLARVRASPKKTPGRITLAHTKKACAATHRAIQQQRTFLIPSILCLSFSSHPSRPNCLSRPARVTPPPATHTLCRACSFTTFCTRRKFQERQGGLLRPRC